MNKPAQAQLGYTFFYLLVDGIGTWQEGGYEAKYTFYNSSPAVIHGLKGGWFLDDEDRFLLGIGNYFSYSSINEVSLLKRQELLVYYGSLYLEYNHKPERRLHMSFPIHLGFGFAATDGPLVPSDARTESPFLFFEPDLYLNFAPFHFMKVGIGAGYRLVGGVQLYGTDNLNMMGPSFNASLKFGRYSFKD